MRNNLAKALTVAGSYNDAIDLYDDLFKAEQTQASPSQYKTVQSALKCLKQWGRKAPAPVVDKWLNLAATVAASDTARPILAGIAASCAKSTGWPVPQWTHTAITVPRSETGPEEVVVVTEAHGPTEADLFGAPFAVHGLHQFANVLLLA